MSSRISEGASASPWRMVWSLCWGWVLAALLGAAFAQATQAEESAPVCPRFEAMSQGLPDRFEWRTHPALADVNGDGHLDIAGHPRKGRSPAVFLGNGRDAFREQSTGLLIAGGTCGVGTDFGDLNEDGHLDLLVADHCRGIHVFLGSERGVWRFLDGPTAISGRLGVDDAQIGDIDLDGHLDIIAVGGFNGGIRVLLGDGTGNFRRVKDTGLPTDGYGPDIKLVDMNADGRLDVVTAFTAERRGPFMNGKQPGRKLPIVWLNGEDGFYDSSEGLPDQGNFRGTAIGDVNGDGHLDLALSVGRWPGRPPLLVYLNDGEGRWRPAAEQPTSADAVATEGVELVDLNGDGVLDLVAVTHLDAGLRVWAGRGDGRFADCPDAGLPGGREDIRGWGVAVGQLVGDERPDIVVGVGRTGQGAIEVWGQVP